MVLKAYKEKSLIIPNMTSPKKYLCGSMLLLNEYVEEKNLRWRLGYIMWPLSNGQQLFK